MLAFNSNECKYWLLLYISAIYSNFLAPFSICKNLYMSSLFRIRLILIQTYCCYLLFRIIIQLPFPHWVNFYSNLLLSTFQLKQNHQFINNLRVNQIIVHVVMYILLFGTFLSKTLNTDNFLVLQNYRNQVASILFQYFIFLL